MGPLEIKGGTISIDSPPSKFKGSCLVVKASGRDDIWVGFDTEGDCKKWVDLIKGNLAKDVGASGTAKKKKSAAAKMKSGAAGNYLFIYF